MIFLGASGLSFEELRLIAQGTEFAPDPSTRPSVEKAAALVAEWAEGSKPVYGVNTGFGKLARCRISPDDLACLQRNLILSHAAGVGPPLAAPLVRIILALKIRSLVVGFSGVRWEVITTLARMAQADILPVIPAQGSVGASGDLAPLAHLAAAAIGAKGAEVRVKGKLMPAAQALDAAKIPPLVLGPKEGLALINGTQVSTALALNGLLATERLACTALITGALSTDAARGSDAPFDERLHKLSHHPGRRQAARVLRNLLSGSSIRESHRECDRVQDPYSLRCQPQVMGACLDLARAAAMTVLAEARGVSDNPIVFAEEGDIISGGHFHAEPIAFAADQLALALAEIGSLAERRIALLIDPVFSLLPAFLTPEPGLNSGFMIPQVVAAGLVAENRQKAVPASTDSLPTSANQEDHVSMATHGARRLIDMADNLSHILAIEWLAAAQGIDLLAPKTTSPVLARVHAALRREVPKLESDRFFAPEIAHVRALIDESVPIHAAHMDDLPTLDPEAARA